MTVNRGGGIPDGLGPRRPAQIPESLLAEIRALAVGDVVDVHGRERPARAADVQNSALALGLAALRRRGVQAGMDALRRRVSRTR